MKILVAITILLGASAIGFIKSSHLSRRRSELDKGIHLVKMLEIDLNHRRDNLPTTLLRTGNLKPSQVGKLVILYGEGLEDAREIDAAWSMAYDAMKTSCHLEDRDIEIIKDFLLALSMNNGENQRRIFQQALVRLEASRDEARSRELTYGRLYRTAGIAIGVVMVILLV